MPGPETWSRLQGQLDGLTQDHSYFLVQCRLGGSQQAASLPPVQLSTPLALDLLLFSPVWSPSPQPWAPQPAAAEGLAEFLQSLQRVSTATLHSCGLVPRAPFL